MGTLTVKLIPDEEFIILRLRVTTRIIEGQLITALIFMYDEKTLRLIHNFVYNNTIAYSVSMRNQDDDTSKFYVENDVMYLILQKGAETMKFQLSQDEKECVMRAFKAILELLNKCLK